MISLLQRATIDGSGHLSLLSGGASMAYPAGGAGAYSRYGYGSRYLH